MLKIRLYKVVEYKLEILSDDVGLLMLGVVEHSGRDEGCVGVIDDSDVMSL